MTPAVRPEGTRQRETLKPCVPTVGDDDIIELCRKYPKQVNEDDLKNKVN